MGFLDEFKRLAHPYEDEDDEEFEDDYEPSPRPCLLYTSDAADE